MRTGKYEEVQYKANKIGKELKRDYRILSIISILMAIIALIISIACMKLGIENDALKLENAELNKAIEMKNSMISDLQEDNMKLQEMIQHGK